MSNKSAYIKTLCQLEAPAQRPDFDPYTCALLLPRTTSCPRSSW
jgi:hypothetical protein